MKPYASPIASSTRRAAIVATGVTFAALLAASILAPAKVAAQIVISPASLIGIWDGVERTGQITIRGEVIFYPNGTYQRHHVLGALQTWDNGTYQVAQNWVHFNVQDYQPKVYNRVVQAPPPSETWMLNSFNGRVATGMIGAATFVQYRKVN
jgi:hypothetical protein